jgi:hypothetical protein
MKKYTIKDNKGNKKTIYAENVTHAIKLVDMGQHAPAAIVPAHQTYNPEYSIQQFKSYIHNVIKYLYGNEYNTQTVRAISKLDAYVSQVIDDFKADIKNSNLDKRKTVQYYIQYVDALYKEITDVKNIQNIDGQSLKKIDDIHAEMARSIHDSVKVVDEVSLVKGDWFALRRHNDVVYKVIDDQRKSINGFSKSMIVETYQINNDDFDEDYKIKKVGNESLRPDKWLSQNIVKFNSAEEAMTWLKRQLRLKKHNFDSKLSDEASLATTINALVTDEKAAIDAYNVAINNLKGKIDDNAMQVLINIMKDERKHVENLYAILNNQVTEKNLEDSKMKDESIHHEWLIEHAKRLYEYAKVDNFRSVKREAENLIDGIDNNHLG